MSNECFIIIRFKLSISLTYFECVQVFIFDCKKNKYTYSVVHVNTILSVMELNLKKKTILAGFIQISMNKECLYILYSK